MQKPLLLTCAAFILLVKANSQQLTATSINLFTYPDPNNSDVRALQDGVAVFFNGQSDTVNLFDLKKITNPLENIAILRNNVLLAGEQRTSMDTIPLTVWNLQPRRYEIEIFLRNITEAYLEDVQANTKRYFTSADTLHYFFTNNAANTPKDSSVRFRLIFGKIPVKGDDSDRDCNNLRNHHKKYDRRFRLYPNPVTGNYVNIDMKDFPSGRYRVSIMTAYRHVASYTIMHKENCIEQISTANLTRGKYYVVLQNENGRKEVRQIEVD